ncbi:MAG: hypothetical protein OHK0022_45150 [Roseiflexaceae bacterium]
MRLGRARVLLQRALDFLKRSVVEAEPRQVIGAPDMVGLLHGPLCNRDQGLGARGWGCVSMPPAPSYATV